MIINLYLESETLKNQVYQKLEATADGRRNEAREYLQGVRLDVEALASNFTTQQGFFGFNGAWRKLGEDPTGELQTRYIDDNPNPAGEKFKLENPGKDNYDRAHRQYHKILLSHLQAQDYYDLFLISPTGEIVYSAMKERDFATNLTTGPYKDSGLGQAFRKAMEGKDAGSAEAAMSNFEPYEPAGGKAVSFIAYPMLQNGRSIGVLAYGLSNSRFNAIYANRKGLGQTGETILLGPTGLMVNDSTLTAEDDSMTSKLADTVVKKALDGQETTGILDGYRGMMSYAAAVPLEFAGNRWAVVALIGESEIGGEIFSAALWSIGFGLLLIVVGAIVAVIFARSITKPISDVVGAMQALAGGDTSIEPKGQERQDEIGDMVRSVAIFRQAELDKQSLEKEAETRRHSSESERQLRETERAAEQAELAEAIDVLGKALHRLAEGDLTATITRPFASGLDRLRLDFNASLERLSQTISSVRGNVVEINGKSRKVGTLTDDLSRRTEEQAAALEETSTAIRQIMDAIRHSSERAETASRLAADARTNSDQSGEIVGDAVSAMERIKNASSEISKIINVIDEIAFQTNLLALNAGVEAARAGEAGKGFAVVAQEVRELAQRSANAAKDIKQLITKSGAEVASGVDLVQQTGQALSTIAGQVVEINDHIHSIAGAARQQSSGLKEINAAVGRIEEATAKNAQAAQQTNAEMRQLSGDADGLSQLVGHFAVEASEGHGHASGDRPASAARLAVATEGQKPAASPARSLMNRLTAGLGGAKAAASNAETNKDWEEF
ncbi:methyl-accepting chemotaxis protein [Rhizobium halophytocola]|uniref:Methyl-accepting chemotaxis protein n=1 Tax=Rhizobium halophytocola TaxID=735519 RepID=A0ABS4DXU1_9HYPH|nr:methyl-accepting chemotaxis protein [Rhizobium halophytocola]MBP1850502.1 methyl-accepting chemotaxis protein [Rhizobium halophytocola]